MTTRPTDLRVSVVVCTNSEARYEGFAEAVDSLRSQTHPDVELVLVVDANRTLYEQVERDFGGHEGVVTRFKPEDEGLSASRNYGARVATGDVVAFTDDDVVAPPDWVAELADAYRRRDAIAVGGPAEPLWSGAEPTWLPAEFYWLVGATHAGFADGEDEVRNTFGCNISFRRDVFLELDGFQPHLGKQGAKSIQGEEAELCARMRDEFGRGVAYNPDAVVEHKVFPSQTTVTGLIRRAFWQGYSKRVMDRLTPDSMGEETEFLERLATRSLPARMKRESGPALANVQQAAMLLALTGAVGAGYAYGFTAARPDERRPDATEAKDAVDEARHGG